MPQSDWQGLKQVSVEVGYAPLAEDNRMRRDACSEPAENLIMRVIKILEPKIPRRLCEGPTEPTANQCGSRSSGSLILYGRN